MEERLSFREIMGTNKFTGSYDYEGFTGFDNYTNLFDSLTILSEGELTFNIELQDNLTGQLNINGEPTDITVSLDYDFNFDIIEAINYFIETNKISAKRYLLIEPYGLENADQCFSISFLDSQIHNELAFYGYSMESHYGKNWSDQLIEEFEDYTDMSV